MTRKKKVFLIMSIMSTIFVSIIYGLSISKSWENNVELSGKYFDRNYSIVTGNINNNDFFEPHDISTFKNLYLSSDIVAGISVSDKLKRIKYTECILSQVKVLDIFKGKVDTDTIKVFEPCYFDENNMITVSGYNLMKNGKKYILFLKKVKCSIYGTKYIYIPTSTLLSKYEYNCKKTTGKAYYAKGNLEELSYNDIKESEIYTKDKKVITFYNKNKKIINNLLEKQRQG